LTLERNKFEKHYFWLLDLLQKKNLGGEACFIALRGDGRPCTLMQKISSVFGFPIVSRLIVIEGKRMSDQTNAGTLSRRRFGLLVAAGAADWIAFVGSSFLSCNCTGLTATAAPS